MNNKIENKQIRNFGILFSFVFLLIAIYPLINEDGLRY